MMAKYTAWLLSFIAMCLSLGPLTLTNGVQTVSPFCDTLPDAPSHSAEIQKQLKQELDIFEIENSHDLYAANPIEYRRFCELFLSEPPRPREILTAFWLKYDGYRARIKRIRDECEEDNKKSLASARELCKLAMRQMQTVRDQHTRDIRYLMGNTVDNSCTDLTQRGDCNYQVTCMRANTPSDHEMVDNYSVSWMFRNVLPGCRIAKHTDLVERLRARLYYLYGYYHKPLIESRYFSAIELEAENRSDDREQVDNFSTMAITKLKEVHRRAMKTIAEDKTETVLGLCLTTLGDMQTIVEDCFKEIIAIRENAWKCQEISQKILKIEEKEKRSDADWPSHIDQFKSDLTRKIDQMHTHFKLWSENRHKIRHKLLVAHSREKVAEFKKQFDEAVGKLDEIRRQAHSQPAYIFTLTGSGTKIDFVSLKLLCPKILQQMESKVLHHDRLEIKSLAPKLVPDVRRFIEDTVSVAPNFSQDDLDNDLNGIAEKVTETVDHFSNLTLIRDASKTFLDKLNKNYEILRGDLQKVFDVITNKQKLCRPFQCTSEDHTKLRNEWTSVDFTIRKKLNEFIPLVYYDTSLKPRKQITTFIVERYEAIYKLIMNHDWHRYVNQLIRVDFELFHTQTVAALTETYDVK